MIISRRKFLFWLGKAPAIVAASSLMPIVMRRESVEPDFLMVGADQYAIFRDIVATTFRLHGDTLYDNIARNNALFQKMRGQLLTAGDNELVPVPNFVSNDPAFYFQPINRKGCV